MARNSVLIVDDDASLLRVLEAAFEARGFDVVTAPDGRSALGQVVLSEPDVVILDLGLPDIDGIAVCSRLRSQVGSRIIVLSADGAEDRKVAALDAGADDYVTKPFSTPELMARVRVALRNQRSVAGLVPAATVHVGDLELDAESRRARAAGQELDLTPKEFSLLTVLARNAGKVLTHRMLLEVVWGPGQGVDTLRTHVSHLRRKLGDAGSTIRLESAPGVGYRLDAPDGTDDTGGTGAGEGSPP
jgi:two-component system, OmpR family, KDP operon response regulator KdpE